MVLFAVCLCSVTDNQSVRYSIQATWWHSRYQYNSKLLVKPELVSSKLTNDSCLCSCPTLLVFCKRDEVERNACETAVKHQARQYKFDSFHKYLSIVKDSGVLCEQPVYTLVCHHIIVYMYIISQYILICQVYKNRAYREICAGEIKIWAA